jgi:hypothetical protein
LQPAPAPNRERLRQGEILAIAVSRLVVSAANPSRFACLLGFAALTTSLLSNRIAQFGQSELLWGLFPGEAQVRLATQGSGH